MRQQDSFTPIGAVTVAQAPAGGSVAVPNPALGTAATALLVSNSGCPASFVCAGTTNTAPYPLQGDSSAFTTVNPGGALLLTDAASLAAPMFQVCGGTLRFTAVAITASTIINS